MMQLAQDRERHDNGADVTADRPFVQTLFVSETRPIEPNGASARQPQWFVLSFKGLSS